MRSPCLLRGALACFVFGIGAFAQSVPTVGYPTSFGISPPLSSISDTGVGNGHGVLPLRPLPPRGNAGQPAPPDAALQNAFGPVMGAHQTPGFPGIGANGSIPPDPNIAVGPNNIVQVVNTRLAIYNKSGAILSGYPKSLGTVWSALGGNCATQNAGDPIVQYDRAADRWFIAQLGNLSAPYSQCIAVSATADPNGSYHLYSYDFGSNLNDYPKFGVWPTTTNSAYVGTYNIFANGSTFTGAQLCAYDRSAMLSGASTATQLCYTISNDGGFLPSDVDGSTAPPDGSPAYFLTFETTSSLRLYKLAPNFSNPYSAVLSDPADLSVASFAEACNGGACIPQSGTGRKLDSLGDRLMYRLAYRNFGGYESMVVNHSVTVGTSVGVRWYELRSPSAGAGTFNLYQQGTFAPDSTYRWMGSAAMDQSGDIALGYSASSGSQYPGIRYTGRSPSDPLGTMHSEGTLVAGGGSQLLYSRWGDYTALRIDPADDCTFWYTNEYYTASSFGSWATAIGSFKFNNCGGASAQPDFSISATPSSQSVAPGGQAQYTVSVTALNGFTGTVSLGATVAPSNSSINVAFNPVTISPSQTSTMTVSTSTGTPAGTYTITITGTGSSGTHSTIVTLVVNGGQAPDFTISATPLSQTISRGSSATYTVTIGAVNGFSGAVNLSVSGLPQKTSGGFNPNPVPINNGSGSSTLTVSTNRNAAPKTYTLTITGTSGSITHSTPVTLVIQ